MAAEHAEDVRCALEEDLRCLTLKRNSGVPPSERAEIELAMMRVARQLRKLEYGV